MEEATAKLSTKQKPFRLRVALCSKTQHSSEEKEDSDDDDDDNIEVGNRGKKKTGESVETRRERHVQFKDEPTSPCLESGSDSKQGSFLEKREQNIKANKAMVKTQSQSHTTKMWHSWKCTLNFLFLFFEQLAQLMADLEKMPGREGFLKNQAEKQKTKVMYYFSQGNRRCSILQKIALQCPHVTLPYLLYLAASTPLRCRWIPIKEESRPGFA